MDVADILLDDALDQFQRFYDYRPFGHPDTLSPDGRVFCQNHWDAWSNKPWQMEFHQAGVNNPHRAILGANGVGKSIAPSWETVLHATGLYHLHPWYKGRRFERAVKIWVGAIDADQQRTGVQAHLLGANLGQMLGTGFVPKDLIKGKPRIRQVGLSEVADQVEIANYFGGTSTIQFKTYAQGWRSWQAAAPDIIQLDEEPDENDNKQSGIWSECVTRVVRSGGMIYMGMTPLLGETKLTRHFMQTEEREGEKGVWWTGATWDDAPHMTEEARDIAIAAYDEDDLATRTQGVPMMGEGRILKFSQDDIVCEDFEIPRYYARICGIDFGIGAKHPTAAAWLAWDRDRDIVFLYDEYRQEQKDIVVHAEAIKRRGDWIPVAWPHDGHKTSDMARVQADGNQVKDIYRDHGVNMLEDSARYEKDKGGAQPQWPIIETLNERIATGRFFVFQSLRCFLQEAKSWHVKNGAIVNRRDDTIKAVLYGLMMLRYAGTHVSKSRASHMPGALRL